MKNILSVLAVHFVGLFIVIAPAGAAPEHIVDIDVNDEVWLRPDPMTQDDVRTLVKKLKANGCDTIIVRAGCLGLLPYQTDLSYPMGFDADHARAHPTTDIPDLEAYIAQRSVWNARYAQIIADFNPPEVFIDAGHAEGMKVIAWIDLFDDMYPGFRSKFLDENPHVQWVGKDGTTYFEGLTDYAWPEARAFRVKQAKELLAWGADGILCSTSSHVRHLPNTHEEDFYGYSQPIVAAYQAKYGVDIRTAENFDKEAWHDLKGDAMVQLYRELAALCHGQEKELWVGLQLGKYTQFAVDPHFSTNVVVRYTNHWKQLVDEGIADAFIVGDYEIVASPDHAYWSAKPDIVRKEGEDLFGWAAREYQEYCKGKTKLYLFSEWLPGDPEALERKMEFWADTTRKHGFDGIDVHEAWNFQAHPDNMAVLGRFSERLKGTVTPYPLNIECEGTYSRHLQGVCTNEDDAIFWSFTTVMVKTDHQGKLLTQVPADNHHGDLCFYEGKVYVAVNLGQFNNPEGKADSWIYVYDPETLEVIAKHHVPEVFHGAGGIGVRDGHFYVVGGLPKGVEENYVYEYDGDFNFIKKHIIESGWTNVGIQSATWHDGAWWFGCYGSPNILLKTDKDFTMVGRYEFSASLGIVGIGPDLFLVAKGPRTEDNRCRGTLHHARSNGDTGLAFVAP